jgi:hypothetical protein
MTWQPESTAALATVVASVLASVVAARTGATRVPRNPENVAGLRRRSFTRGSLPAALVDDATTDIVLPDYVKSQV